MGLEVGAIAAIISAASAVVSLAVTLSMDTPDAAKDSGSAIDRKGQDNPKVVPFGKCIVPATRVWNNVNNSNVRYLAQAYSFGVGQIRSFEQIYIDGVPYFKEEPLANKWYENHSDEFPNVDVGLRLGKPRESDAYQKMMDNGDGEWTNACRGDRTPSLSLLAERVINTKGDNNIRFISDRVSIEALVHGNAVIDPRTDINDRTWVAYRNPACIMFTYLVDNYYGLGVPVDAVDVGSFVELANHCERNDLTFDGYIDQGSDYAQILVDMCSSFDGMVYVEDGLIKVKADHAAPAVAHITTDHIVGSFKLSNTNDSNYYNVVNCEFINADTNYTKDKYVLPKNVLTDQTIQNDGFEKAKDFKFLYTSDSGSYERIKKLANKKLKQARYQQTIELEIDNTLVDVSLHDVIEVTHTDYNLNKSKFRITKVETTLDDQTMVSKITATEYNPAVYDSSDHDDGIVSPPIKPPTNIILSPVNLKFLQEGFTTSGTGKLSWDTRYFKEHKTVIEYKLSSASSWKRVNEVQTSDYSFNNLRPDNYDFRVMTRDFFGNTSEWTTIVNQKVQGGVSLPNVTGLKGSFDSQDLTLSWDDMKTVKLDVPEGESYDGITTVGDVFDHYELVINKGASSVYKETLYSTTNKFTYTFDMNASTGINRNIEAVVYVVAKDGSKSLTGSKIRKINAQTTQPTGLEVNAVLSSVTVLWEQPLDKDFYATDIHISDDAAFVPSGSTLVHTENANSYTLNKIYTGINYIKVGHYDKFGKDGMSYSPALEFTQKTIDDVLDDSANWGDLNNDLGNTNDRVDAAFEDIKENAKDITVVNETLGDHQAQITSNKTLINSTQGNLASFENEVSTEFEGVKSSIKTNSTAISNVDEALTEHKEEVIAEFNGVKSSIQTNKTAIANANEAISSLETELSSELDDVKANLSQNYYTKTSTDGKISTAVAASESKLNAEIGKNKASINTLNQVTATTDGKVEALTQIKHDVNGKVSGLIMGNDGETSTFDVIADKFRISSKAGDQAVFQVDTATGKTVIKAALIGELDAGKITTGTLSGDRINATSKIFVGSGNSSATLSGSDSAWRLAVGNAQMSVAPFRVTSDGKLFATNADITGHINATSGRFSGLVEGSTIKGSTIEAGIIRGGVITGAAIQGSYIASDVPLLTLTWRNQEEYGSMSIEVLESQGRDIYFGYQTGVTDTVDAAGTATLRIASYDYKPTSQKVRYTRRHITPNGHFRSQTMWEDTKTTTHWNTSRCSSYPPYPTAQDVGVVPTLIVNGHHYNFPKMHNGHSVVIGGIRLNCAMHVSNSRTCTNHGTGSGMTSYAKSFTDVSYSFTYQFEYFDYSGNRPHLQVTAVTSGSTRNIHITDVANNISPPTNGGV